MSEKSSESALLSLVLSSGLWGIYYVLFHILPVETPINTEFMEEVRRGHCRLIPETVDENGLYAAVRLPQQKSYSHQ